MIGYMKGIPQQLIVYYGAGKAVAKGFSLFAMGFMTKYGSDGIKYFFPTMLFLGLFIIVFDWIDERRLAHHQSFNVFNTNRVEKLQALHKKRRDNRGMKRIVTNTEDLE